MVIPPDLSSVQWRKSRHSSGNGECVELADMHTFVAIRDSKDPSGPVLSLPADKWHHFTRSLRDLA
ncbi:DUF397 domain-containing protein [Spirillospora sp. NPDC052269]